MNTTDKASDAIAAVLHGHLEVSANRDGGDR